MCFAQRRQNGLQRGVGILAVTADVNFIVLADAQSQQPDNALARSRIGADV